MPAEWWWRHRSSGMQPIFSPSRPAWRISWRSISGRAKKTFASTATNVAERLGFLGRVVHGVNARAWVKELRAKLGEPVDHPAV